jgi:hypothetical protein
MLVNPVQLFPQLVGIHETGTQYSQSSGFADFHHHIATVGEGKDRDFYAGLLCRGLYRFWCTSGIAASIGRMQDIADVSGNQVKIGKPIVLSGVTKKVRLEDI